LKNINIIRSFEARRRPYDLYFSAKDLSPQSLRVADALKTALLYWLFRPADWTGADGPIFGLPDGLIPTLARVAGLVTGNVYSKLDLTFDQKVNVENFDPRDAGQSDVDGRDVATFELSDRSLISFYDRALPDWLCIKDPGAKALRF